MSLKIVIAKSVGHENTGHTLRARDKAAIAFLVLLMVAVTVGLLLMFAAVGVILAMPLLLAAGLGALLGRRSWRAGGIEITGALPPAGETAVLPPTVSQLETASEASPAETREPR